MRLLNEFIYALIFLVLFAAARLYGQTQGNLPNIVDANVGVSNNAGCPNSKICTPENWSVGDVVVACVSQNPVNGATSPPWGVTDDCGNTWTLETAIGSNNIGHGQQMLQMAHTVVTTGGACNIHIASLSFGLADAISYGFGRFTHISGTLDGGIVNSVPVSSDPNVATTSKSTTVNGDLAVSCATTSFGAGSTRIGIGSSMMPAVTDDPSNAGGNMVMGFQNCGLAGTCAPSMTAWQGNSSNSIAMQTAFFKPSGIGIVDTVLPDGGLGSAYKATLHGVGGAGAYTCSITAGSLQTGLALSGTGNCDITGTPSASSTNSITFQISDGTINSTKTLSLRVAASLSAPSVTFSSAIGNTFSVNVPTAKCGDVILLCPITGDDTHGGSGWVQAISGISNYFTDTFNSPVQRVALSGQYNGPNSCIEYGPLTSSGPDMLTWANNQSASSGLAAYVLDIVSGQGVIDAAAFNNNVSTTSSPSVSVNYVTPVADEMLVGIGTVVGGGTTITVNSPFNPDFAGSATYSSYNFSTASSATPATVTYTANYSIGSAVDANESALVVGLRPGIPVTALGCSAAGFGPGEKIRRADN